MKTYFYEVLEPYSAVIKAHNEDEVFNLYTEVICDVEGEEDEIKFIEDLEVISDEKVKKLLRNCRKESDEGGYRLLTEEEQEEAFNQDAPSIILMEEP